MPQAGRLLKRPRTWKEDSDDSSDMSAVNAELKIGRDLLLALSGIDHNERSTAMSLVQVEADKSSVTSSQWSTVAHMKKSVIKEYVEAHFPQIKKQEQHENNNIEMDCRFKKQYGCSFQLRVLDFDTCSHDDICILEQSGQHEHIEETKTTRSRGLPAHYITFLQKEVTENPTLSPEIISQKALSHFEELDKKHGVPEKKKIIGFIARAKIKTRINTEETTVSSLRQYADEHYYQHHMSVCTYEEGKDEVLVLTPPKQAHQLINGQPYSRIVMTTPRLLNLVLKSDLKGKSPLHIDHSNCITYKKWYLVLVGICDKLHDFQPLAFGIVNNLNAPNIRGVLSDVRLAMIKLLKIHWQPIFSISDSLQITRTCIQGLFPFCSIGISLSSIIQKLFEKSPLTQLIQSSSNNERLQIVQEIKHDLLVLSTLPDIESVITGFSLFRSKWTRLQPGFIVLFTKIYGSAKWTHAQLSYGMAISNESVRLLLGRMNSMLSLEKVSPIVAVKDIEIALKGLSEQKRILPVHCMNITSTCSIEGKSKVRDLIFQAQDYASKHMGRVIPQNDGFLIMSSVVQRELDSILSQCTTNLEEKRKEWISTQIETWNHNEQIMDENFQAYCTRRSMFYKVVPDTQWHAVPFRCMCPQGMQSGCCKHVVAISLRNKTLVV